MGRIREQEKIRELVSAYLDGELSPDDAQFVGKRIQEDPAYAQIYAAYRGIRMDLRALERPKRGGVCQHYFECKGNLPSEYALGCEDALDFLVRTRESVDRHLLRRARSDGRLCPRGPAPGRTRRSTRRPTSSRWSSIARA